MNMVLQKKRKYFVNFQQMWTDNKSDKIVTLFSFLYGIAIIWELTRHYDFIYGTLEDHCSIIPFKTNYLFQIFFGLLIISIFAAIFVSKLKHFAWLLASFSFFLIFRSFVTCHSNSQNGYAPMNQAIVFWILLTLALKPLLNATRTIFLIKFYLLFSYFSGGIAKIRSGFEWTNGWTLKYHFIERHATLDLSHSIDLVSDVRYASMLSWLVIILELLVPLALLSKFIEYGFVFAFLIFQLCCWYFLEIYWMVFYGWAYLIYVSIFLVYLSEKLSSNSFTNISK
jgi:hypothetical protein